MLSQEPVKSLTSSKKNSLRFDFDNNDSGQTYPTFSEVAFNLRGILYSSGVKTFSDVINR